LSLSTVNTYKNTDKTKILNFVQDLGPSPEEAPFIASIFEKSSYSNRDLRTLFEFLARRAPETPLQRVATASLGLPTLPNAYASAANTAPVSATS
jgi:hypothetical protein